MTGAAPPVVAAETLTGLPGVDGHLPECGAPHLPWPRCEWCRWAVSTPEVLLLLDAAADARTLLATDPATVAWVVAAGELVDAVDGVEPGTALVPSVQALTDRLRRATLAGAVGRLSAALDAAVAPGGPVEAQCLRTAGALAAAVAQDGPQRAVLDGLPLSVRTPFLELAAQLSSEVQVDVLLPVVDHAHWHGLPPLRTQPAWERRPPPDGAGVRRRQLAATSLAPGSLEALVVESLVEQVTSRLVDLGAELVRAAPPVALARPASGGQAHSGATRATLWRIARFDWHLTFVDTGRATCWDARLDGDLLVTDVPWLVAAAIDAGEAHGLVSATHRDLPERLATVG